MRLVKKLALAAVLSVSALLPSYSTTTAKEAAVNVKAPTLEEQIQNVEEAKVLIRNHFKNQNGIEFYVFGSGCIYQKKDGFYYIVTNTHVVEESLDPQKKSQISIVDDSDDEFKDDDIPLEIVVAAKTKDVAIVKAKEEDVIKYNQTRDEYNTQPKIRYKKKKLGVYKGEIANSDEMKLLDHIIVAGYPLTIPALTEGKVSNTIFPDLHPTYGWDHECSLITTPISPGNSGSGSYLLKDNKLYFIGVVHAVFHNGQNMNLLIKVNEFKDMLFSFKNPDDLSDEEIKTIAKQAQYGTVLENLFSILNKNVQLVNTNDGFKFIVYTGNFPTEVISRMEILDSRANGFGNPDVITYKEKEKTDILPVNIMPKEMQKLLQEVYNITAKNIALQTEYKKILNKEGKLSLYDYEMLRLYKGKVKNWSVEYEKKASEFENKIKEYVDKSEKLKLHLKKSFCLVWNSLNIF